MRNKKGQFTSNGLKGNQFAKGNPPNRTSFKTGGNIGKDHPNWKGGKQRHENWGILLHTGYKKKRIRQSRAIYKTKHGVIPKGYVIYHIDGDRFNDHVNNLEAISRGELVKRNYKKYLAT